MLMRAPVRFAVASLLLSAAAAHAFCGFYVSGAGAQLFNDATMVVLVRDGTRTVLSMQNTYRGPTEDFAMVVPVPVVLQKDQVKTLPKDAFRRLDELTSPRLVEQSTDECLRAMKMGAMAGGAPTSATADSMPRDLGVKVEAKFDVEEYEIVILSAQNSMGLDIWLKEEKYKIPPNAEPLLRPYVAAGMKFFVAKVNAKKAKFKNGEVVLSPLRFQYDTESLSLPVRLGLVNSQGTQDLIVHVIAKSRYEVANATNVQVPTNLDVRAKTKSQFGAFYSALLDKTLKKTPRAAVTEFAWQGALPPPQRMVDEGIYGVTCDPCPPPHPVDDPLATYLGVRALPNIKTDKQVADFAAAATVTRIHLRYTKDAAPDDLVFRAAEPIAGGIPEQAKTGPAKKNRFQGRYIVWIRGCSDMGNGGFSSGPMGFPTGPNGEAIRSQALTSSLKDPLEALLVADLPELNLVAKKPDAPPKK